MGVLLQFYRDHMPMALRIPISEHVAVPMRRMALVPRTRRNLKKALKTAKTKEQKLTLSYALDHLLDRDLMWSTNPDWNMMVCPAQTVKYKRKDIKVYKDSKRGLNYVIHTNGHKLYFARDFLAQAVQKAYRSLLMEQDKDSPHLYLTASHQVLKGDNVADIGTAEGNFSLDVVERVGHLYLFETEERWIEALEATFYPWNDKVTIVNKFVSDKEGGDFTTLDSYFKDKELNFIKADIEGAEKSMLEGAKEVLDRPNMRASICLYHKPQDQFVLSSIMKDHGFSINFSKGYMVFPDDETCLRRGMLYCEKR